ncbi:hypothetical protein ACQY0O_001754 [Thecaphora frezii]
MRPEDRSAFHLLGHPLPALIDLPSTSGSTVDLFLLSLRKPILLFLYPQTVSYSRSFSSWLPHLGALRSIEPDLEILALSTQPPAAQLVDHQTLKLQFHLVSDHMRQLATALDIPTQPTKQDNGQGEETVFRNLTMLLRGGQITRIDYPIDNLDDAAERAKRLLVSEEELMREIEERDKQFAQQQ